MTETDHLFIAGILSTPLLSTLQVQLWAVIKSGEVAQSRHLLRCVVSLLKMQIKAKDKINIPLSQTVD